MKSTIVVQNIVSAQGQVIIKRDYKKYNFYIFLLKYNAKSNKILKKRVTATESNIKNIPNNAIKYNF